MNRARGSSFDPPAHAGTREHIAFAMQAFGKPGAEIAKMSMTTEEFRESLERGRKFKGILPENAGEEVGRADDAVSDLKDAFEGLTDTIGIKLLPAFTDTINRLAEFVAANRELIATRVSEFLQGVAEWLKSVD
jgi:hypothetical protein